MGRGGERERGGERDKREREKVERGRVDKGGERREGRDRVRKREIYCFIRLVEFRVFFLFSEFYFYGWLILLFECVIYKKFI